MSRKDTGPDDRRQGRREFLRTVGIGGVGAAAAAAVPAGDTQADEPQAEQVKERYRLSPHVERFYFLNRL